MKDSKFYFKKFSLAHSKSALKIGTDSVLLSAAVPITNAQRILDIGCGCGVILFCLAQKLQATEENEIQTFIGIDIDENSVVEALENRNSYPKLSNRKIDFEKVSLQAFAPTDVEKFDLIVSNPPYFGSSLLSPKESNCVSKHRDANLSFSDLVAGVDKLLSDKGSFFLILPVSEMELFRTEISKTEMKLFYEMWVEPIEGKSPNRIICGFSRIEMPLQKCNIAIRKEDKTYHSDYIKLTQEFYLHF